MHAFIEHNVIVRVGLLPDWRDGDTGEPLTDAQWLEHGWRPVEDDAVEYDPLTHARIERPWEAWRIEAGRVVRTFDLRELPPAPPLPAPELDDYRIAVQERVDAVAQTKRYDSGVSMASYTNSTDPTWAAEAQAFVAWRDRVWGLVYSLMDGVLSGEIAQPSIEELLTELPAIEWPSVKAA